MKREVRIVIRAQEAGVRIVDILSHRFTYLDRGQWLDAIASGDVVLNGCAVSPETFPAEGDVLEYRFPDIQEPPVHTDYSILFEDTDLLAVDKPPHLPCHPGGRYFNHTLWALLKKNLNMPHLSFVNRLDRETSGVVLAAKTSESAARCRAQFDDRQVFKRYVALVEGAFPEAPVDAAGYMVRDENSQIRKKVKFCRFSGDESIPAGAKACRTHFRNLMTRDGLSMVEAVPETGRIHQIRAVLSGLGYCMAGDKIYGVDETIFLRFIGDRLTDGDRQKLRLSRQALHAADLHVLHPKTGIKLCFHAPVPDDMKQLMRLES